MYKRQYYDRNKENAGYLHEKLNLDKQRPIVLFPCRIHEQKRPFMLLDIAEGVIKNVPDVAFVVNSDIHTFNTFRITIKYICHYLACSTIKMCIRDRPYAAKSREKQIGKSGKTTGKL